MRFAGLASKLSAAEQPLLKALGDYRSAQGTTSVLP
jgi:hypothetical protein